MYRDYIPEELAEISTMFEIPDTDKYHIFKILAEPYINKKTKYNFFNYNE